MRLPGPWRRIRAATALGIGLLALSISPAAAAEIGPDDDLCAAINQLTPGAELRLLPGDYRGPCVIARGGTPTAPIAIVAADAQRRPRIVYDGLIANVLEIRAGNIIIRGLEFGPTQGDVDGVRVIVGNNILIEDCRFVGMGGIAVVANHMNVRGLAVRGNVVEDSRSTAMYFGCHNGQTCVISDLLVADNRIRGVTAAPGQIGYGLEIKLNSSGVVRDNVVLRTKGPGIMVYGSRDLVDRTIVERNIVMGSATSAGILVGGGPALIRNNVSLSNNDGGIGLQDYGRRNLLRQITITHNTVYGNDVGGVTMSGQEGREISILNNAIQSPGGTPALPPARPGVLAAGNVDCTIRPCFMQPDGFDFSPFPGSALVGPLGVTIGDSLPRDDLFRTRRGIPPTIGAIERPSGPILLDGRP